MLAFGQPLACIPLGGLVMIPGTHLMMLEKLSTTRKLSRAAGALVAVLIALLAGYSSNSIVNHPQNLPAFLVEIASNLPLLLVALVVLLAAAAIAVALFVAHLPIRRSFAFDRANLYVIVGRHVVRYSLASVLLSNQPHSISIATERYLIESADAERLAGLLQLVFAPNNRRVQPVAISNPTEVAEMRRKHNIQHAQRRGQRGADKKATKDQSKLYVERHPTMI
jgi:hypothetical protein